MCAINILQYTAKGVRHEKTFRQIKCLNTHSNPNSPIPSGPSVQDTTYTPVYAYRQLNDLLSHDRHALTPPDSLL